MSQPYDVKLIQEQSVQFSLPGILPGKVGQKRTEVVFDEPLMSSDGGTPFLAATEKVLGLIDRFAACLKDDRHQSYIDHSYLDMLRQRVFQIAHGYEDVNDCDSLRGDPMLKLATGRDVGDDDLASQPTVSRLENSVGLKELLRLFYLFVDIFIESYEEAPEAIVLDMDPTACRTYGDQQLSLFNTHVQDYCLMPFHIYEGQSGKFIATIVREGKTPTDKEIIAIMKRIVKRIRRAFPKTMLIFRADSHHCKPAVLNWLRDNDIHYIIALSQNAVLNRESNALAEDVRQAHENTLKTVTKYHSFSYAAGTWRQPERVIARAIGSRMGKDVRYIVTSFQHAGAKYLYEDMYCPRGNAELYIKEHKNDMKSSRMSCHQATANQFRQCLHSAAYVLVYNLREKFLQGTALAKATMGTIRLRLLKVAARVESGKTFTRLHLPTQFSFKSIFQAVAEYAQVT